MSTKTLNIGLVKPDFAEFTDSWNIPLNNNFDIIDANIGTLNSVTSLAAGSQSDIATRLNVSMNADGTLKNIPEVTEARNSTVYGADNGTTDNTLDVRLELGDREVFDARAGAASLLDASAAGADDFVSNSIISSATNYLTFTGAIVKADGSATPVVANINGYRRVVRTQKSVTISGAAQDYFIYLDKNLVGDIVLDRTVINTQNTGAVGADVNLHLTLFTDNTQNFVTAGIQPGDTLQITSTGSVNAGQYVVASVNSPNVLAVVGRFASAQASLNYKVVNPLASALAFTATAHAIRFQRDAGRVYIGRCTFDGTNITNIVQYAAKGRYEQWFSVSLTAGNFLTTAQHKLGYVPTKLSLYASQANDYTQPLEPLGVVNISGAGVSDDRAVVANMSQTLINVKNVTNGVFYKDFSGVAQVAGFLLIVAER